MGREAKSIKNMSKYTKKSNKKIDYESILKNIETQRTTKTAIFFKYDSNQRLGLASDINQDIYSQIPMMTSSDLMRFYSLFMKNNKYNYCIVAKRDKINIEELKKLGEFEEISLDKLFGY